MSQRLYNLYAQESYSNSYDHGFWEDHENRNHDEMIMLMINELSECQEAHRSGKHNPEFLKFEEAILESHWNDNDTYDRWYKNDVKGCTGEELADVVIRIFDYVIGWNLKYIDRTYQYTSKGNFSADLLLLNRLVLNSYDYEEWYIVISIIEQFANNWDIDLEWHIKHKQRYNRNRPYKHGKKY